MITQINTDGDNIAGCKYVNIIRSIQARDLTSVVDEVMQDICCRDLTLAADKLNTIKKLSSLESEVISVLNIIELKIKLVENTEVPEKTEILNLLQNPSLDNHIRAIISSILIDIESRVNVTTAMERYAGADKSNSYIKEVFFEHLATKEEISEQFKTSNKNSLLPHELVGLIRGSLRIKEFALAVEINDFLHENFSSPNSIALLIYCKASLIADQQQQQHYFTLTKQVKDDLDNLVAQLTEYFKEDDLRYIYALIFLLEITQFLNQELVKLGKKHIERVHSINENYADTLDMMSSFSSAPQSNFKLTDDNLNLDELNRLHSDIENGFTQLSTVNKWLDGGGNIQAGDDFINFFADLRLRAVVCSPNDREKILSLESKANEFIALDKTKFLKLNPFAIIILCERFIELNLALNAVEYLSPFISDEQWVSPSFECYLNALIASEKYELFFTKIKHLSPEDKPFMILVCEAQAYERIGQYDSSIMAASSATKISPNNPHAWNLLLYVSRVAEEPIEQLKKIVSEIPSEIFSNYNESKIPLVNQIATFIDLNFAEIILVDWFVQDPDTVASPLSQVHINSLDNRSEVTNPYTPNYCCDGVRYTDGFDTFSHILVKDIDTTHSSLLDIESPKGQILNSLQVGELIRDPIVGEIKLLERLPPVVAAFRLSIELRNKSNDGSDVFKLVTLSSNQDDIIPSLEKILRSNSRGEDAKKEILKNTEIPLAIRCHYSSPNKPINSTVHQLTLEHSNQYFSLFNDGLANQDKVIIDIHTAVYFALTGLVTSLKEKSLKIILSQQTKSIIEQWIKDILREDYLTLSLTEQGIQRQTSEDIRRTSREFIQELEDLVTYSEIEDLTPLDTPDELIKIRDIIDETVYSTFQLSIANQIPLLCIDDIMCALLNNSGHLVVNAYSLVMELLVNSPLEIKKKGIQMNLLADTPMPILYSDIFELSRSTDKSNVYLVAKFIEKYGVTNKPQEESLDFLVAIAGQVTSIAYIDKGILNGGKCNNPTYDGYADQVFNFCCRAAIEVVAGTTAEERLTLFISSLIQTYSASNRYSLFIKRLASTFAKGHFLNIREIVS